MKFRGKLTETTYIQYFTHSIQMISKFCKNCIIRFRPEDVALIAFEETGQRRPLVWLTITQRDFFSEYLLHGVTPEHNEIVMRVNPHVLYKVFTSVKVPQLPFKMLKLSLAKRKSPCLTIEYFRTEPELTRMCLHDIPVEVISRKEWGELSIPEFSRDPDLSITLPPAENLEMIWDKLKSLSRHVVILANGRGTLSLRIETDVTDVTSHFKELPVTFSEDCEDLDRSAKCRVRSTKFMLLKDLCLGSPERIVLKLWNKKYLLFNVFYAEYTLNYIVPVEKK